MGGKPVFFGKLRGMAAGLTLTALIAGCAPIETYHGFIPPQEEVAALQIGVSTKADVIGLLGQPIAERALQNNAIYYASSKFEQFGPFAPNEVDRQVLELDFDSSDRLRNVTSYTLEDGRVVILDRRVTEDGIADVTFLGQLLASFGRLDAGALLGPTQ
ncbi:outer membrane protein assembly factor BamE [Yoonia litorea]|uniref:Beta-barrel assembly machine subunit BamE n=1 Tax=Yoonia litorea TaxID=1123755 RepID=A0A1I6LZM3_9RHOB|nr:outer membrane protein assembly factor BamE [Yoonia litorea]SFS08863.1 Beta-barrel assembly machine subunit BamE [Yoonia litorea]